MEYTVNQLAKISGISTRALRYYDEIGLLKPVRKSNQYRVYGTDEVDKLQQILFYRELGIALDDIKKLINAPDFDRLKALEFHLSSLLERKKQIEILTENVRKTIRSVKGEIIMNDTEKFEGLKQKLVDENEQKFGKEAREKYGDKTVDEVNTRLKKMNETQYMEFEKLSGDVNTAIKEAFETGDPKGEKARHACELHKKWLCFFWGEEKYCLEAHKNLAEMYVCDERFKAYYDSIAPGCAEFLRDALEVYCTNQ
jgi:DNA-binding transcriptional MerR regulator